MESKRKSIEGKGSAGLSQEKQRGKVVTC